MSNYLLFSGGIDSCILLSELLNKSDERIFPVFVDYGQLQLDSEKESSYIIHKILKAKFAHLEELIYLKSEIKIFQNKEYIPFRNFHLIKTLLEGLHVNVSADIYLALIKSEESFKDCQKDYLDILKLFVKLEFPNVNIHIPYIDFSKMSLLEKAVKYQAPIESAYCCNFQNEYHCNKCSSCIDRRSLFKNLLLLSKG